MTEEGNPEGQPTKPKEILVRLVGDEDLKPFEQQTLDIAKRTYRLTKFGFWIALGAAVFVGVQVREMTNQTQILAIQSESADARSLMDGMNTRKQVAIAQQQADAAEKSVRTLRQQLRLEQTALLVPLMPLEKLSAQEIRMPITQHIFGSNIGKTSAVNTSVDVRVEFLKKGEEPSLIFGDDNYLTIKLGTIFPSQKFDFVATRVRRQPGKPRGHLEVITIRQEDLQALANGARFSVYGRVTYQDIFGHSHWFQFCATTTDSSIPLFEKPLFQPRNCEKYNGTDGEAAN